jgi:hypothetical protein
MMSPGNVFPTPEREAAVERLKAQRQKLIVKAMTDGVVCAGEWWPSLAPLNGQERLAVRGEVVKLRQVVPS